MRIFSGIQPTGAKHFGNWSGGFRQYADTQERAASAGGRAFFCIVDLHSITVDYDPADLRERTLDLAALLFSTGLEPERSTVFAQSHVTAHAEAAWLFSAVTSYGQLGRMTQFKEKGDRQEFVSAGLFTYPILMAGDILLYQTDFVPIGDDQRQHLELARDIAERFNARFGETFTVPSGVYPEIGARIMDLQEPTKKMSTTGGSAQGTLLMLDSPDVVRKKVRSAVTDSGSEVRRGPEKPGVTNLIDIMTVATGESAEAIEARYDGGGYGPFKGDVAEAIVALLEPIQQRYAELRGDPAELTRLLALGAGKAREVAAPTLRAMYERMGFVPTALALPRPDRLSASAARPLPAQARHSPGSSPSTAERAVATRCSRRAGWPTRSSMRFTWRLRPSWIVSSTRPRPEPTRPGRSGELAVVELDPASRARRSLRRTGRLRPRRCRSCPPHGSGVRAGERARHRL